MGNQFSGGTLQSPHRAQFLFALKRGAIHDKATSGFDPENNLSSASIALAFAALLALWAVATQPAQAQTFTVLYKLQFAEVSETS